MQKRPTKLKVEILRLHLSVNDILRILDYNRIGWLKLLRDGVQQDYAKESLQELEVGIEPYESGTEIQESGSSPNRQFWKTWEDLLFQDF